MMLKKILFLFCCMVYATMTSQDLLMDNGVFTQCSGIFYDSGGEFGNYNNNESLVTTICPVSSGAGEYTILEFLEFATQSNLDVMTIYDGDDISAPQLLFISGPQAPFTVSASDTNTSGCLTIEFVSNETNSASGWVANILCATPCQDITAVVDSTVPSVDVNNDVSADIGELIEFNGSGIFSVSSSGAIYTWDFGDGNTAVGSSVSHAYSSNGIYNVTLTITDDNPAGCQSTNNINLRAIIGASTPGNPFVDAGEDIEIPCGESCTDLDATFLEIGNTTTYTVSQIPFVPPFPFSGLSNSLNPDQDDVWSTVENLPFDLCFFGGIETQFQIGSNGVIRFDVNAADNSNNYVLNTTPNSLPNNSLDTLSEANVFSPCHDINPAASNSEQIAWEIIGTAPNRVLAVSFFEVPLFQCTNLEATHMIVFYETTNVIDIYIKDKPICTTFNGGLAVVGIQNDAGTSAFVPPGRNTSQWTTNDEAWRFTPNGPSVIDFAWLDSSGAVVANTPTVNVCPSSNETYTARVIYTNCNGDQVTVTDDVLVTVPPSTFSVNIGPDQDICEGEPDVVLSADISSPTATYQWALDGVDLPSETNTSLTVSSPNSGLYSVVVTDQSCSISDDIQINFIPVSQANTVSDILVCDDTSNDGFAQFDLSQNTPTILGGQDPLVYQVSYHESLSDADTNTAAIGTPTSYTNTQVNSQTIYARVENPAHPECYATTSFNITVNALPSITPVLPLEVCDDDSDGVVGFPLSNKTPELLNGQTGISVSYHESLPHAVNNILPLSDGYINTTVNTQTLFVRLEDDLTGCFNTTTLDLSVLPLPTATLPTSAIATCDDDTDGIAVFDLTQRETEILGGQTAVSVTYHTTQGEADAGTNAIGTPNAYSSNSQTLFVRVTHTITNCYSTTTLDVVVNPLPLVVAITDFEQCDNDASGNMQELFDLSSKDAEIINGQPNVTLNYYASLTDANTNTNPVTTLTNSTTPQEVFVVLTNTLTGCTTLSSFNIVVHPLPTVVIATDLEACDGSGVTDTDTTDGITNFILSSKIPEFQAGNPNIAVSFHENLSDAELGNSPLADGYENTTAFTQTLFVRLENTVTGCLTTNTLNLVVQPLPLVSIPSPLAICDDDEDGLTVFNLTDKDAEIIGGQVNITVSYYLSEADAFADVNAIATPTGFTNTEINNQLIYARLTHTLTGCANVTSLQLVVDALPTVPNVTPFALCDSNNPGDEQEDFNLSIKTSEITLGQPSVTVAYYPSEADAIANTNPITSAYTNTSNPETIFAVMTNTITSCSRIINFEIEVNPLPVLLAPPTPLEVCDDDTIDGFTEIDLNQKNAEITNSNSNYAVTYYESESNAAGEIDALSIPYMNTQNPQVIYFRLEDITTGCFIVDTLQLDVLEAPVANTVDPLYYCDPDNDGFGFFDLPSVSNAISGGVSGVTVSYYESQVNANNGVNVIDTSSLYQNTNPTTQTVWARVESAIIATPCATVVPVDLIVEDTPQLATPEALELCDDDIADGFTSFDLTLSASQILNGLNSADYPLSYYETEALATVGSPGTAIVNINAYTNTTPNMQTVWVRVDDPSTSLGCFKIEALPLVVYPRPIVVQPTTFDQCDDLGQPNDGITVFDLTQKNNEIRNGDSSLEVAYYATEPDALAQTNAIDTPTSYTNTSDIEVLYVVVTHPNTGCVSFATLTLRVLPNPTPTPSENIPSLALCDVAFNDPDGDGTNNAGIEVFNLRGLSGLNTQEAMILNGETGVTVSYYETLADADAATNAIADPENYSNTSTPQTIYVRITNNTTDCYAVVDFDITVNPLPELAPVTDYILCELNTDGFVDTFDFSTKDSEVLQGIIDAGHNPNDYIVTYHDQITNAEDITNTGITGLYTNTSNPQPIFIRIENIQTGCFISTASFNIEVNEAAVAHMPEAVFEVCATEVANNSVGVFDLTTQASEILSSQDPNSYAISYYESFEDADAASNAIPDSANYNNFSNPQIIYARVDNNTLVVIPMQGLDLTAVPSGTVMDFDGNGTNDLVDTSVPEDGIYDTIDIDNNPLTDEILSTNPDSVITSIDINNDGVADPIDYLLANGNYGQDGLIDNQIDSSVCYEVTEIILQVNPLPEFTLDPEYILCVNTNGTEALSPALIATGLSESMYSFEWQLEGVTIEGANSSSLSPLEEGNYSVIVTTIATQCSISQETSVRESAPPTIALQIASDAFASNTILVAEVGPDVLEAYEFSLDGGPWQDNNTFTNVSIGEHTVRVRDKDGCGLASNSITVMDYPHFFTPNGDGINESWNISGENMDIANAKIYIFDRYGKLLKQISPLGNGWDGTYNGVNMPSADYWFTINYNEPRTGMNKTFKSHFTLKR